jgi:hypothetical protein
MANEIAGFGGVNLFLLFFLSELIQTRICMCEGQLWMKLHESNQYRIGLVLRFSSIEIHLDLESGQDWAWILTKD